MIKQLLWAALAAVTATAADVTIEWDANPEPDVAGYELHWGPASRQYTNHITTTNTHTAITNLPPGSYYVAALAFTTNKLRSDFSEELFFSVPKPPARLRVSVLLQKSAALNGEWQNAAEAVVFQLPASEQGFFRAAVAARLE
jgi:hypothetical protein